VAGLPKVILIGLPEMAVKESVHRTDRALANLGYDRPTGHTITNLAPADLLPRYKWQSSDGFGIDPDRRQLPLVSLNDADFRARGHNSG
jgi:hypothetical protein